MTSAACQLRPVFAYTQQSSHHGWDRPPPSTVIPVKFTATTSGCKGGESAKQTRPPGPPQGGLRQQPSGLRQQPEVLSEGQNRSYQLTLTNGNSFLSRTEQSVIVSDPPCSQDWLETQRAPKRVAQQRWHAPKHLLASEPAESFAHTQLTSSSSSPAHPPQEDGS